MLNEFNSSKDDKIKVISTNVPKEIGAGEKLMNAIFISTDKKIHHSIICKNTDSFNKIEQALYKEFPEYKGSEIVLLVDNRKVKKSGKSKEKRKHSNKKKK